MTELNNEVHKSKTAIEGSGTVEVSRSVIREDLIVGTEGYELPVRLHDGDLISEVAPAEDQQENPPRLSSVRSRSKVGVIAVAISVIGGVTAILVANSTPYGGTTSGITTYGDAVHTHQYLHQYQSAKQKYLAALAEARTKGDHRSEVGILTNLSVLFSDMNDSRGALATAQSAVDAAKKFYGPYASDKLTAALYCLSAAQKKLGDQEGELRTMIQCYEINRLDQGRGYNALNQPIKGLAVLVQSNEAASASLKKKVQELLRLTELKEQQRTSKVIRYLPPEYHGILSEVGNDERDFSREFEEMMSKPPSHPLGHAYLLARYASWLEVTGRHDAANNSIKSAREVLDRSSEFPSLNAYLIE